MHVRIAIAWAVVVAAAAAEAPLRVEIDKAETYRFDGKEVKPAGLQGALRARASTCMDGKVSRLPVEVTCDPEARAMCFLGLLLTGAREGVCHYTLVVGGKTVPVELPSDLGLKAAPGTFEMTESFCVDLCGGGDFVGHQDDRKKHYEACLKEKVSEKAWCWIDQAPSTLDEAEGTAARYAAVADDAAKQVKEAKPPQGGEERVEVRADPNVATRDLHAFLSALAERKLPFDLEAPPSE